jgi:Uma2 family endonuclease
MQSKYDFPRYTYNDYKNWKEDWELIDGYPINLLPSASISHNKAQMRFIGQSLFSLQKNKDGCNCEVFAELDWKISEDTVVRPDLMIICGETTDNYLEFPPVLIIEIISPSSVKKDRVIKFDLYREQGVKYYLMADYTKKTIEAFELIDNYYKQVDKNIFTVDKNCEILFEFDKIWE